MGTFYNTVIELKHLVTFHHWSAAALVVFLTTAVCRDRGRQSGPNRKLVRKAASSKG